MSGWQEYGGKVLDLFGRLVTYKVDWEFADHVNPADYEIGADRVEANLDGANVASSLLREFYLKAKPVLDFDDDLLVEQRHVIALDIDYTAHLLPSHTEGHHHLYLEVPGGVAHSDYMELLELLGRIGVIEQGYAEVSRLRGHTDLRLPWVAKEPRPVRPEVEMAPLPVQPITLDAIPRGLNQSF